MAVPLQTVRHHLGYTAAQVIDLLVRRAAAINLPVASKTSLKIQLSRWENGKETPSKDYRRLFREIYGRTNAELGFPDESDETPKQLNFAPGSLSPAPSTPRPSSCSSSRSTTPARSTGASAGSPSSTNSAPRSGKSRSCSPTASAVPGHSWPGALMEASTLAGWQALDRAALGQAWTHYERAKTAAAESTSPTSLTHALGEQAFLLIDLGETTAAVEQLAYARSLATHTTSKLLRAWLAAAHGEALAAAGHGDDARRAFDTAQALLPPNPVDPDLPFLFLGGSHLDRWRGHALARLGAPDAIDQLTSAVTGLPPDFVRARTGLLVDLTYAHAATGDRDTTLTHARRARLLAMQIKSDRQLRRLNQLVLPSSAPA